MTTNQTIDGVPRKLLEDCVAYLQGSHRAEVNICIRLLRDLLYRDSDTSFIPGAHEFKDAPLPTKADYQKLDAALADMGIIKPAAQPQGEPVAMMVNGREGEPCMWFSRPPTGTRLYAEQPAPVAVVVPTADATGKARDV